MPKGYPKANNPELYDKEKAEAIPTAEGEEAMKLPGAVKQPKKKKAQPDTVDFRLGDDVPEELLVFAGRLPSMAIARAGCLIIRKQSGGAINIDPVFDERTLGLVDRSWKKILQKKDISLSPEWAYVLGSAFVGVSAITTALTLEAKRQGMEIPEPPKETPANAPSDSAPPKEAPAIPEPVDGQPEADQRAAA